jgi:MraZ protein
MTLFLSTFTNKLDKKGRVSVPAPFRLVLSGQPFQGIVGFRSYKLPAIEGMGIDRMQRLSDSIDQLDAFSETHDDLTAAIFADAQMLAFDGDGRVVVPDLLLDHAKIRDVVAFVGQGATFQIWNPEIFAQHQQKARERAQEKKATFKIWGNHA